MSDRTFQEWRVGNSFRAYPLEENSLIPNSLILDACFYLTAPIYITSVKVEGEDVEIVVNTFFSFKGKVRTLLKREEGKILLGPWEERLSIPSCQVPFQSCITYPTFDLSVENLSNTDLKVWNELEGYSFQISLPLTPNFECDCVQSLNGVLMPSGHAQLHGDDCTSIMGQVKHLITIDDICLPPCYNCNARISAGGDVHNLYTTLEERVSNLET